MYSCGSLAPKLKRGGGGGCMDHQFHKPAQPWEKSEGYIRLLINHYNNTLNTTLQVYMCSTTSSLVLRPPYSIYTPNPQLLTVYHRALFCLYS